MQRAHQSAAADYGDGAYDALEGWRIASSESVGRLASSLAEAKLMDFGSGESAASFRDPSAAADIGSCELMAMRTMSAAAETQADRPQCSCLA